MSSSATGASTVKCVNSDPSLPDTMQHLWPWRNPGSTAKTLPSSMSGGACSRSFFTFEAKHAMASSLALNKPSLLTSRRPRGLRRRVQASFNAGAANFEWRKFKHWARSRTASLSSPPGSMVSDNAFAFDALSSASHAWPATRLNGLDQPS
jgi:hypothetical protein